MVSQLNYCRFMYYLAFNSKHLPLSAYSRGKLVLVLFKHLLKVIKQLTDDKNNWFLLGGWEGFRGSVKHSDLVQTLKEYGERYEKEYLKQLKSAEIRAIKEVNQLLPELSVNAQLSTATYTKLLLFLLPLLQESNEGIGHDTPPQREAFCCLLKYYRLVHLSLTSFQDFQTFAALSNITVLKDYVLSDRPISQFMAAKQEVAALGLI